MPPATLRVYRAANGTVPLWEWLLELENREPKVFAKCIARILRLEKMGYELRRPEADFLRDGIYEIRIRHRNVNYRILYFFVGKNVAYLSHGITKESDIPDKEIDLAIKHNQQVEANSTLYTAIWEG